MGCHMPAQAGDVRSRNVVIFLHSGDNVDRDLIGPSLRETLRPLGLEVRDYSILAVSQALISVIEAQIDEIFCVISRNFLIWHLTVEGRYIYELVPIPFVILGCDHPSYQLETYRLESGKSFFEVAPPLGHNLGMTAFGISELGFLRRMMPPQVELCIWDAYVPPVRHVDSDFDQFLKRENPAKV